MITRWTAAAAQALAFVLLATLNANGYRFGASDQSFYLPAILQQLDPALFPRDRLLLAPQSRYFLFDELAASLLRHLGGSLEGWFLAGHIAALALLYFSLIALGKALFRTPLAATALVVAMTLRHRIAKTGVNSLEGYFHPRVLVFAIGLASLAIYVRGRPRLALALVVTGGLLHPSTAAIFVVLIGAAAWVTDPPARRPLGLLACAAIIGVGWMLLAGPWQHAFEPMDAGWRQLLESKDYLFPTRDWSPGTWLLHLAVATLALGGLAERQRRGVAHPRERGLLVGTSVLVAGFLLSVPLLARGAVLPIQLQVSRVFWIVELVALVPLIGWLVDQPAVAGARPRARAAVVVLLVASVLRAGYLTANAGDRTMLAWSVPDTDWTRTLWWLRDHTPPSAHILADPGHAWKYGVPLRLIGRDVYLEDVKDTSMALYSRDVATRVIRRIEDLPNFDELTAPRARELAVRYRLDYLVSQATLDLPLAGEVGAFRIYTLR